MTREHFKKKLEKEKFVKVYEYDFILKPEGVTIMKDDILDSYIIDNGKLSISEAWWIMRKVIDCLNDKKHHNSGNGSIYFGRKLGGFLWSC